MDKILNKKKIILIIGGGIAAYKALDLIRLLKKQECEIKIVLTLAPFFLKDLIISKLL